MKFKRNIAKVLIVLLIASATNVANAMDGPTGRHEKASLKGSFHEYESCTREYKGKCVRVESTGASSAAGEPVESPQQRKERILADYQPNFAEMQKIGLGVTRRNHRGEEEEILVVPDVHFRGEDGKEYFVFYNNHFGQLRNVLLQKLEEFKNEHDVLLFNFVPCICSIADGKDTGGKEFFNTFMRLAIPGSEIFTIGFMVVPTSRAIIDRARALAWGCGYLKRAMIACGSDLGVGSSPCALVLNRDLAMDSDSTKDFLTFRNTPGDFAEVERNFISIAMSSETDTEQITAMEGELDRAYRKMKPWMSNDQMIDFCFALNRASYYLSMLERDIQSKSLASVEAMDRLRRKVNRLLLEYRFIFEQSVRPFFGIKVDRCKILEDTKMAKTIFLDRSETKKFQQEVEKELDRRAQSLRREYKFENFSGEELRKLACELKPDNYQSLIDSLDDKIADMERDRDNENAQAMSEGVKGSLKIVDGAIKLSMLGATGALVERKFNLNQVQEYLKVEDALQVERRKKELEAAKAQVPASACSGQDSATGVSGVQAVAQTKSDASKPFVPTDVNLNRSFDNPKNIVCSEDKGADSSASEVTCETAAKVDTSHVEKQTVPQSKLPMNSGLIQNNTDVGKLVQDMMLSREDVDLLTSACKHAITASCISKKIAVIKRQKENLQNVMDRESDFVNLFKLYIQLVRGKFDKRTDFGGSLITEKRGGGKNSYQYEVREIQRQEEFV